MVRSRAIGRRSRRPPASRGDVSARPDDPFEHRVVDRTQLGTGGIVATEPSVNSAPSRPVARRAVEQDRGEHVENPLGISPAEHRSSILETELDPVGSFLNEERHVGDRGSRGEDPVLCGRVRGTKPRPVARRRACTTRRARRGPRRARRRTMSANGYERCSIVAAIRDEALRDEIAVKRSSPAPRSASAACSGSSRPRRRRRDGPSSTR